MDVLEQLRACAADVLDRSPVLFAYLYGSHATGTTHPRSDVDVERVTRRRRGDR